MAISDNKSVEYEGEAGLGSHWSCLAYSKSAGKFYLFDSMARSGCAGAAQTVLPSLSALVGHRDAPLEIVPDMPQQVNGWDCGVYTMAVARLLCAMVASGKSGTPEDLHTLSPDRVNDVRVQVRRAIEQTAREQNT